MSTRSLEETVGSTPLVRLAHLPRGANAVLAKLEGCNPAGSVKDRPALAMIRGAEQRGEIRPGDTLIEATSGNTGIALAMAAALHGYPMVLIMPEGASEERRASMRAYGARLVSVSAEGGMEAARDLALEMQRAGRGHVLDQFANPDNPEAHFRGTGPEIWRDTGGAVTHFVAAMGTTGTVMGVSRYFQSRRADVQVIGVQPAEGAHIPGIRRWPEAYRPRIFDPTRVDRVIDVTASEAEDTACEMARREGILCGVSAGGAVAAALQVDGEVEGATLVVIVADRGDRYLSTGLFS